MVARPRHETSTSTSPQLQVGGFRGGSSPLQPLFDPAHPQACVRAKTPISLVDQVPVKPHEAKSVNERVDVDSRQPAVGLGGTAADGSMCLETASVRLHVLNDARHSSMIA